MREYTVPDLFFTKWDQLNPGQMSLIIELTDQLRLLEKGSKNWGLVVISILRNLRKNKSLVSQLEVEQAVDCFNELEFILRNPDGSFRTPWYFFPVAGFKSNEFVFLQPVRTDLPLFYHTFQQLVYADSAFSAFCLLNYQYNKTDHDDVLTRKQQERDMDEALCSLIAVLYTSPDDFDIADMEVRARHIPLKMNIRQRSLLLLTYANVRQFITDRCPNLFPKPIKKSEEEQPPVFSGPIWMNLRYDLAKTEVFKGFKTASDARIYDALDFLEKETIEFNQPKPNGQA